MNTRNNRMRWLWAPCLMVLGLLYAAFSPTPAQAQLDSRATGTTYVIAYPDTTTNTFDTRYPNKMEDKIYAYIYSAVDNKITVNGNGYNRVLTAKAGKFEILELTDPTYRAPQPIVTESGKPSKNTFRIEAQQPIVVYCYMVTKFGAGAWTPIPVEFWGTEYYAQAQPGEPANDVSPAGENNYNAVRKMAPAEILVIASEDNTIVTFTPNGRLLNNPQITGVKLMKDEAYQIQSWVDTSASYSREGQPDIAGTYIQSTKPIGVLSGNTRTMVYDEVSGLAKNSFKDLTMEWVAPIEQHGHQFVYMPTMDDRRPKGLPGENLNDKRTSENVRIYATNPQGKFTKGVRLDPVSGAPEFFDVGVPRLFADHRLGVPEATFFKTDSIAEAFMTTTAVVKFLGTSGSGNYIGAKYDGWGTYAVEMTPREQWVSSAPYFAPIHPSNMDHKMNIVTDTASARKIYWGPAGGPPTNPVLVNKPIKGTDLIWGDISVPAGLDLWITGWDTKKSKPDTSVKFYGFVYGLFKGHEEYRPGKVGRKDDDDDSQIASAGGKGDEVLHPSEYEEYLAVTYGYPLAPSRIVLRPGDSLRIDTTNDCVNFMRVQIQAINENPVGLRSISLDSINNAKLIFVNPANPSDIIAKSKAEFRVVPINPLKNASAVVVIRDRTNKEWRFRYFYEAEYVNTIPDNPALLNFGQVTLNQDSPIKEITVTNPLSKPVTIEKLSWADGTQEFRIIEPTVPPAITLQSGESIKIKVQIKPTVENKLYEDSLKIKLTCTEVAVKVQAETVSPCIYIGDLPFGELKPGESKTLDLQICNNGRGVVVFNNPSGTEVVEWLESHFTVTPEDLQAVKDAVLGPNECITIKVTFMSNETGAFVAKAKFFDNTKDEECKDLSTWTATVKQPGPQITGKDWEKRWVTTLNTCTKSGITQYDTVVSISNDGSSDFIVNRVEITEDADGVFALDTSDAAVTAGQAVRSGLLIRPGAVNARYQKVIFTPKEEKTYTAKINLITMQNGTVSAILQGVGIESHIDIAGYNFGRVEYQGATTPPVPGNAVLTIKPTRPTTITDIRITGADAANFRFAWPQGTAPFNAPPPGGGWMSIPINTEIQIPLEFTPQSPGDKMAMIEVFGDFSKCDVSIDTLFGTSYTLTAEVTDVPFPTTLTCFTQDSAAFLTNSGSDPVVVEIVNIDAANGAFVVTPPQQQFDTLAGGESLRVPVTFMPMDKAQYNGSITFRVTNLAGQPIGAGTYTSNLSGQGNTLTTTATIDRGYSAFPGVPLDIPVTLDVNPDQLDEAMIQKLSFNIKYNPGMMRLTNGIADSIQTMLKGTLLEGWTATVDNLADGEFVVTLTAPPGSHLTGAGTILNLHFMTFVGNAKESELEFDLTVGDRSCATITTNPGHAVLEEICGLDFRLIEAFGKTYALNQNSPNPFNPSTNIIFSLGLDGPTTLTIYNAAGEKVAVLVDQYLQPGTYTVTWDASAQPSGLYYYRLESGVWTKTESMILRK